MNVVKKRLSGYSKFQNAEPIARLIFGTKFSKSAYQDSKLHPALEALLQYVYTEGKVDPVGPIKFGSCEQMLIDMLLSKLKEGSWKSLDERVNSPLIAMAVIHEYLKALPKSLWCDVKIEDWRALSDCLQQQTTMDLNEAENCVIVARVIFSNIKTDVRRFTAKLLVTLHQVVSHCDRDVQAPAAFRLAEYFSPVLLNLDKNPGITRVSLQNCVALLIEKASAIFGIGSDEVPREPPTVTSVQEVVNTPMNSRPHRPSLL